ncbi:MAG: ABC transporter ATP-binding protein [Bacteriovoracaceae bacterium]|jgi:ABC-type multidrug transport system fused ATPase/permease subunit|nr:ABC transporter ATP-binding protein [Bacteriovoracaceae bacterium]
MGNSEKVDGHQQYSNKGKRGWLELPFYRFVLKQFLHYFPFYIIGIISLYFTHRLQTELPFLAKELGELVASGNSEKAPIGLYFLLACGIIIFRSLSRILFFHPARVFQKELRLEMLERLEQTNPERFSKFNPGQIYQRIYMDIEGIRGFFGFGVLQTTNMVIALVVIIPRIVEFDSRILIACIPMLVSLLIFTVMTVFRQPMMKRIQNEQGDVQNFIIESYLGKMSIKNYQAESHFFKNFDTLNEKELDTFYKIGFVRAFGMPLIALGVGLSFAYGAYLIHIYQMPVSSLILFSGFIFLFQEPLSFIGWIGVVISRTLASWSRLKEFVEAQYIPTEGEIKLRESNLQTASNQFKIPFWDHDIEFEIVPSQWTVFVGLTGEGKSYVLEKIAQVLREKDIPFSMVAQNPYLFNDTIENNLFLGSEVTEDRKALAYKYLKIFYLEGLGEDIDDILALEVGENGKRLSGGQAKRLSLVRSLLSNVPTLIWDDPFSSVDLIMEREIIKKLQSMEEVKDKTVLLSTHRLSTVKKCQRVVLLDKEMGILEDGVPLELITQGEKVYEHFEKQMV